MRVLLIICCFHCISCNHEKENQFFVIPEYNEKYLEDSVKYAPYDYYGPNNVIITEPTDEIYYHDNWTTCGTGWNVKNPPRKLDFNKNPLLKVNTVDDLIKKINQSENNVKLIMVASNMDTIKTKKYFELKDKIRQNQSIRIIATRKTTYDEIEAIENSSVIEAKE